MVLGDGSEMAYTHTTVLAGLTNIMDWCQRCYADNRTERQILMGVPHYCKGPRVRALSQGSYALVPPPALPKHLQDSPRFSYDKSPYFKAPRDGSAAPTEENKDASQQGGEDHDRDESNTSADVDKGDDMHLISPRQQKS